MPLADVPVGEDEADNVEIRKVMATPKEGKREHFDIGEKPWAWILKPPPNYPVRALCRAAPYQMARLERALSNFMLDLQTGKNLAIRKWCAPVLVRDDAVYGTGQLPKFSEDLFRTENGYWLTPTAEVTLTNLVREEITDAAALPLRFAA